MENSKQTTCYRIEDGSLVVVTIVLLLRRISAVFRGCKSSTNAEITGVAWGCKLNKFIGL